MTRLASEIRETGRPIFCSACFNSQPIRHVDFDAACDRGYGQDDHIQIAMDDLILCENCVREGAMVLGIEDSRSLKAELQDVKRKLDVKAKLLEKAERYAATLEDLHEQRGTHIDHRKKPRRQEVPV